MRAPSLPPSEPPRPVEKVEKRSLAVLAQKRCHCRTFTLRWAAALSPSSSAAAVFPPVSPLGESPARRERKFVIQPGGGAKGLKTSRFNLPSLCLLSLSNSLPSCVFVVRPKRKIRCPRRKERKVEWSPVSVDELERDGREKGRRRRMESGVERKKLLSEHARITGCCSCSHLLIPLSKCMREGGGNKQHKALLLGKGCFSLAQAKKKNRK